MALFFASFHPPKSWKYGYVPPVLLLPRPRARVPLHARKSDAARSKLLFRPRGMRRPDRVHQPHHLRHDTRHLHRGHQSAHQRLYPTMTWCRNYAACTAITILPSWAPVSMSSAQWQRSTRRPSKTSYPPSSPCQSQSQSQSQSQTKNEPRSDGDGDGDGDKDELHTNCDEYNSTIATNTLHDRHQQPNIRCCHASIFDFDNDKDDTNDNICDRSSFIQRHRLSPVASSTATNINHVYYKPHCLTPQFTRSLQSWLTALPRHRSSSSSSSSQQTHNGKWTHLRHARRNVAVFDLTPAQPRAHQRVRTVGGHTLPHRRTDLPRSNG